MNQQAGTLPTYIALGLAVLAAIMSRPEIHGDIDSSLLWFLTAEASTLDMPQDGPPDSIQFAGP